MGYKTGSCLADVDFKLTVGKDDLEPLIPSTSASQRRNYKRVA